MNCSSDMADGKDAGESRKLLIIDSSDGAMMQDFKIKPTEKRYKQESIICKSQTRNVGADINRIGMRGWRVEVAGFTRETRLSRSFASKNLLPPRRSALTPSSIPYSLDLGLDLVSFLFALF